MTASTPLPPSPSDPGTADPGISDPGISDLDLPDPSDPEISPPSEIPADGPEREALLADRSRVLAGLAHRYLDRLRALWFLLLTGLLALGWSIASPGIGYLLEGDLFNVVVGGMLLLLAAAMMVPSALALADGVREDLGVRAALRGWAVAARRPQHRPRWHRPGRALLWLLCSMALACTGATLGAVTLAATLDEQAVYPAGLGLAVILASCGTLGLVKAVDYYRLVVRELSLPPRPGGGAHR